MATPSTAARRHGQRETSLLSFTKLGESECSYAGEAA
jgi:hypothetical protein